ncbi:MAG: 2-oxoacid:acceptor oxidoreductase subunit alpha [FCB group bacterium]|nr:2-oxoacid:acceptor oxidoreductase subunit alpha [FCB group bacterium]
MPNSNTSVRQLMQGNEASALGALYAGCRFFGGYPITPSTEIAEGMARMLPRYGGHFIQMEDEIGSMASIIGASCAGVKSMTATSGPGFSLMQENLGYAYMAEVPCVVVNVQRGGPSTGLPTKIAQSDTMQARWGTHGDYQAIALAPASVRECFEQTVKAFNFAERFRTPVIVLSDEVLGHMREMITIPEEGEIEVINREKPDVPSEWYHHFEITPTLVSPMAAMGDGYRFHVTGLTHDQEGFPTAKPMEIEQKLDKLKNKITRFYDELIQLETEFVEDAGICVLAYGTAARAARQAVHLAREKRIKAGLIRPITLWPFPEEQVTELLAHARKVLVVELNMGQLVHEIERIAPRHCKVASLNRYDGEVLNPVEIFKRILEVK